MTCVTEFPIFGLVYDNIPAWDGGARSLISLDGDGYFAYSVASSVSGVVAGLNGDDTGYHFSDIKQGFYFSRGEYRIIENGFWTTGPLPYSTTDKFYLFRVGSDVLYIHSTSTDPTDFTTDSRYPGLLLPAPITAISSTQSFGRVFLDASLYEQNDYVFDEEGGSLWLPAATAGSSLPGQEAVVSGSVSFTAAAYGSDTQGSFDGVGYGELSFGLSATSRPREGVFAGGGYGAGGVLPFLLRGGDTLRGQLSGVFGFSGGLANGAGGSDGLGGAISGKLNAYTGFRLSGAGYPLDAAGLIGGRLPFDGQVIGTSATFSGGYAGGDAAFDSKGVILHMDGADGSTTFVDNSQYGATVTTYGDAQVDDAQGVFNESGLFDGNGDYLGVPDNPDLRLGGGDFVIQMRVRFAAFNVRNTLVGKWTNNVEDAREYMIRYDGTANDELEFIYSTDGNNDIEISFPWNAALDTWYHIAVVRSGNELFLFVDGVLEGSAQPFAATMHTDNSPLFVGMQNTATSGSPSSANEHNGWIDELIVQTDLDGFIPGVAGDPNWNDVDVLVTAEDPGATFTNFASGGSTLSNIGTTTPTKTAAGPLSGTQSYDSGNNNAIAIDSPSSFGTGDFTVEAFVKFDVGSPNLGRIIDSQSPVFRFERNGSGFFQTLAGGFSQGPTGTTPIANDTFYHVAYSRSGGTGRLFINGVQEGGDYADSTDYTWGGALTIGATWTGTSGGPVGLLDNIRITNGVGRYTSNFTAPVEGDEFPQTAVDGDPSFTVPTEANPDFALDPNYDDVILHLRLDEDFNDRSTQSATTVAVADAAIVTNQSISGIGSAYLDGVGDYIDVTSTLPDFGTADFTIEFYYRPDGAPGTEVLFDGRPNGGGNPHNTIYTTGGNLLYTANGTEQINASSSSTIQADTWYHIAVSRVSGTTRMFVNGTQVGGNYVDATNYTWGGGTPHIGASSSAPGGNPIMGWLADVKLTQNVGRYSSNFTINETPLSGGPDNAGTPTVIEVGGVMGGDMAFDLTGLSVLGTDANYVAIQLPELSGGFQTFVEDISELLAISSAIQTVGLNEEEITDSIQVTESAIQAYYAFKLKEVIQVNSQLQQFSQQAVEILSTIGITDARNTALALFVSETAQASAPLQIVEVVNLVEQMVATGQVETSLQAMANVTAGIAIADAERAAFAYNITEASEMSDSVQNALTMLAQINESMALADSVQNLLTIVAVVQDGVSVNDNLELTAQYFAELMSSAHVYSLIKTPAELSQGWVMNTEGGNPISQYDNYVFNSLAYAPHQMLGANDDGIYVLEGDDDAGVPIAAELTSLMLDFATSRQKRVSAAWVGYTSDGELILKVRAVDMGEMVEYCYKGRNIGAQADPAENRVKIGKGLRSRYWQFELANVDGADFEIDQVELYPIRLGSRV